VDRVNENASGDRYQPQILQEDFRDGHRKDIVEDIAYVVRSIPGGENSSGPR
jgi:hypothetical protein